MNKMTISDFIDGIGDGIHGTPIYSPDGEYFFINGNNLKDGVIALSDETLRISESEFQRIKRPLSKNSILISINGTIGNVSLYNGEKVALGKSACYINVKPDEDRYYIKTVLTTKMFLQYALQVAHGSTIKNLAPAQIAEYSFEAPERKERDKISYTIRCIDEKIALNKRINAELEAMAKTIYDYWFVQYDFPDENGKPYRTSGGAVEWNAQLKREIPKGWTVVELSSIENNIVTGKTPATSNEKFYNGQIPFITIGDIRGNTFIVSTEQSLSEAGANSQKNKYIHEDALCVTCIATPGLIGFTTQLSQTNQQINSIVCQNVENRSYLYFALNDYFKHSFGAKIGATFANMNKDDFSTIKVVQPLRNVKIKFYEATKSIFEKMKQCSKENHALTALRDWLLPMLMNGQATVE